MRDSTRMWTWVLAAGVGVALAASGCADEQPLGSSDLRVVADQLPAPISDLDVLFVIDDSQSMQPHQDALIAAARDQVFAQLADELGALPNLHVGVTTTDMGGPENFGCPGAGVDGRLLDGSSAEVPACAGLVEPYLVDVDDGAGGRTRNYDGDLADAFSCLASVGTAGCGFEQPLKAMRAALDGTHAENAGFLRDDAMLLVVFVTDEDDCSADDALFDDSGTNDWDNPLGPMSSFRCFDFGVVCDEDTRIPGAKTNCRPREDSPYVMPVPQAVEALLAVKSDPSMVMVAGLDGSGDAVTVEQGTQANVPMLTLGDVCPSDDVADGWVNPAVRLEAFLSSFPARNELGDICGVLAAELAAITTSTAGVMAMSPCLLAPLDAEIVDHAGARCRAWDVVNARRADEQRVEVPACDGDGDAASCFAIRRDVVSCPRSGLIVDRSGVRQPDSHFVVECD